MKSLGIPTFQKMKVASATGDSIQVDSGPEILGMNIEVPTRICVLLCCSVGMNFFSCFFSDIGQNQHVEASRESV